VDNKLFKASQNREYTSDLKQWFEENLSSAESVRLENVWIDVIPALPPNITTNVVSIISDLVLTEDQTVAGQQTWVACSQTGMLNTHLGDFIAPDTRLSQKYAVKIFDSAGTAVVMKEWLFDYHTGILTFSSSPLPKYQAPFHLFAYQYVGRKGTIQDLITTAATSTLGASYEGPNLDGNGRFIYTDNGPVVLHASKGYAPLQIDPITYIPTIGLADGQICLNGGIVYVYDNSRSSWVSMQRQIITFGSKRADGVYMSLGDFSSNLSGWPALRNGIITGVTCQASGGYPSKGMSLIVNSTTELNFSLSNLLYINPSLSIPFNEGDVIKILVGSAFDTTYGLLVNLEIGWKL